jgi:mRNA-degrading endonuclease RelE of RelBE toxin-antitoxin system
LYSLEPTKAFEKGLKELSGSEQRAIAGKLKILAQDPFHPSLRTKKSAAVKGRF